MNSERLKQIEMENILSQGDLQNLVETCNKQIRKVDQDWKEQLEEVSTGRSNEDSWSNVSIPLTQSSM